MSDPTRQIIDTLASARRVLVSTHIRPDGDAIGSAGAMVLALRRRGIAAEVLLLGPLPAKYAFVFRDYDIPCSQWEHGSGFGDAGSESGAPSDTALGQFIDRFDAVLIVDTGTWSQLPGLREHLERWPKPKIVIDHHLTQEGWADVKLVVPDAAAAGEIAAGLIEQWGVPLDAPLATCLFVAITSDTGWFQFANTRPHTLRMAARLIEAGVNTDRTYQLLYQNERAQRLAIQARALQSLELLAGGRLAVMTIRREDFHQTGADTGDTENLINLPLQVSAVEVSVLIVEPQGPADPLRISLRSKGRVDVARFAERFGGGGHARASGLRLHGETRQVRREVVDAMAALLNPNPHK